MTKMRLRVLPRGREDPCRDMAFFEWARPGDRGANEKTVYTKHVHAAALDDDKDVTEMSVLKGKRVLLGVSGGIAAYKAVELLRLLTKEDAVVDVIMTPTATHFVGPETFRALSGRPVLIDLFDRAGGEGGSTVVIPHLEPAEAADLAIVAPATANTLAKMALGIADNALVTTLLSVTAPVLAAPAMDSDMWRHPATQANVELLRQQRRALCRPWHRAAGPRQCGPRPYG